MDNKKYSIKTFTAEEQAILRNNPYTYSVTVDKIYHTKEFKEAFYKLYQQGERPCDIMKKLGYDLDILGHNRAASTGQRIREEYQINGCFSEGYNNGTQIPKQKRELGKDFDVVQDTTVKELALKVKSLESKVAYQSGLLEFIKDVLTSSGKK